MKKLENEKFSVVIVSYNPDNRLFENIKALTSYNQIKDILILDNSTEISDVVNKCKRINKVKIISCNGNKGIAYAQNLGILKSKELGYNWVLLLDHDTIVRENLINKYIDFINYNSDSSIAIVSTDYYDIGKQVPHTNNKEPIEVNLVISSGSLLNIEICIALGGMKEYYFIDQVDNEYCYRVKRYNYKIIILPGVDMEHRLGDIRKINFGIFRFYTYNQNPNRTFFRTRNCLYFIREYKSLSLSFSIIINLIKDLFRIFFERNKLKKFHNFFKGICHGLSDNFQKTTVNKYL